MLFLSIVGGIAAIVVNYLTYDKVMWSILTTAVFLYYWSAIIHSIRHHVNVASQILVQAVCASVLTVIVDYVLGFGKWSINYVVPSILMLAGTAVLIIILVNRIHSRHISSISSLLVFLDLFLSLCSYSASSISL
jgi:hypothetical protein